MVMWIIFGVLAAFGALCVLWVCFGFLLPGQRGAVTVCLSPEEHLLRRHGWLRDIGLIHSPLILLDSGMTEEERTRLTRQGITICDTAELLAAIEQERRKLDRA